MRERTNVSTRGVDGTNNPLSPGLTDSSVLGPDGEEHDGCHDEGNDVDEAGTWEGKRKRVSLSSRAHENERQHGRPAASLLLRLQNSRLGGRRDACPLTRLEEESASKVDVAGVARRLHALGRAEERADLERGIVADGVKRAKLEAHGRRARGKPVGGRGRGRG